MLTQGEIIFILDLVNQERVFFEDRELEHPLHEIDSLIVKLERALIETQIRIDDR